MAKKVLFTFELEPGMVVYDDVLDNNGRLILSKGMTLDDETIQKLDFFAVSEIPILIPDPERKRPIIEDEPVIEAQVLDYSEKVKATPEFKTFTSAYEQTVQLVQTNLDGLFRSNIPIKQVALINAIFNLLNSCKTTMQLFDIMYNLDPTDEPTYHHCLNVSLISVVLGRWLGFKKADLQILALAGVVHDIGKLTVPIQILNKNGKLSDDEFAMIKSHVRNGYEIIKDQVIDSRIKDAVLYHHERCDGSGYPSHLGMDKIPAFAKIIAIADVYDAMTSSRSYRKGHCPFEVIQLFDSEGYHKYDTQYIMTFLENIVSSYLHNNVKLSDGREGEIVMINSRCLYKPMVRVGNDFIDLYSEKELSIVQIM